MKTKLDIAKERKARKTKQQADIEALVTEIKQFHEALNDKQDIDLSELTQQLTELPELIAEPLTKSLEGFLTSLKTHLSNQKQTEPDLSKLLKNLKIENPALDLKPVAKEIAKLKTKAVKQSQAPEDFVPYRRVVKLGNKFFFDDNFTPSGSGGGGGLNVELETDGSIPVTVVAGGGSSTPNYTTRIETDSVNSNLTYIGNAVIGTAESTSAWQIKRLDSTTGLIKLWRDGDDSFNNQWSTRESGSYS